MIAVQRCDHSEVVLFQLLKHYGALPNKLTQMQGCVTASHFGGSIVRFPEIMGLFVIPSSLTTIGDELKGHEGRGNDVF